MSAAITWHQAEPGDLPDAEQSVLVAHGDREVCEGFLDGIDADGRPTWLDVTAWPLEDVYAWAEIPEGPEREAKNG